jgi:hypothetical protein
VNPTHLKEFIGALSIFQKKHDLGTAKKVTLEVVSRVEDHAHATDRDISGIQRGV